MEKVFLSTYAYFLHVCGLVSCRVCWKDIVLLAADDSHGQLADHQSLVTCGWDGRRRVTYWNNILMFEMFCSIYMT